MKVFLDTNIFIRYLTRDDEIKFQDVYKLFGLIENSLITPYTSNIVIIETYHFLTKVYKIDQNAVRADIDTLLSLRNLTIIEKTDTKRALELLHIHPKRLSDVIISLQVPRDCMLCSYDKDFQRFDYITVKEPLELISLCQ